MTTFAYVRIQPSDADDRDDQRANILAHAVTNGIKPSQIEFVDEGSCCFSVPLHERPEGRRLLEVVTKGDRVIIRKYFDFFSSHKERRSSCVTSVQQESSSTSLQGPAGRIPATTQRRPRQ